MLLVAFDPERVAGSVCEASLQHELIRAAKSEQEIMVIFAFLSCRPNRLAAAPAALLTTLPDSSDASALHALEFSGQL